jgi:large subunit ribosomal protein L22
MESIAKVRYARCSARKVRSVADLVRNKNVDAALALLFSLRKTKKSAEIVDTVLQAAVANLREKYVNETVETSNLVVKSITVDAGPHIKRTRPRAQGRAFRVNKKLCHLTVSLTD